MKNGGAEGGGSLVRKPAKMGWIREQNGRGTLTKRALRVEGRRRRGRPKPRWEDCVRFGGSSRGVENESEGWGSGE